MLMNYWLHCLRVGLKFASEFKMKFQIGKNGINEGVIECLDKMFKKHRIIRVSVLKNSERDREKIKEMADELCSKLSGNYKSVVVGFVIILRKVGVK